MLVNLHCNYVFWKRIVSYFSSPFIDVDGKRSSHGDSLYPLDGVRGLAVLIVVMSHTSAFGMYRQGSLGVYLVDLFSLSRS